LPGSRAGVLGTPSMIPPGHFPPPPPGPSPFAPPRTDDEAVPTPRAAALAPWAPEGAPQALAPGALPPPTAR
jgi:hypothetical protein